MVLVNANLLTFGKKHKYTAAAMALFLWANLKVSIANTLLLQKVSPGKQMFITLVVLFCQIVSTINATFINKKAISKINYEPMVCKTFKFI